MDVRMRVENGEKRIHQFDGFSRLYRVAVLDGRLTVASRKRAA